MSVRSRIALLFNVKTSAALDAVEDPREVLDYAYGQQRSRLRRLKRGRMELAGARRLTQRQATHVREQVSRAEDQARRALRAGREDLARAALERKQSLLKELAAVQRQLDQLAAEEAQLACADRRLSQRVDRFRIRRAVLSARYAAAETQVAAGDLLGDGWPDQQLELSLAVERAEESIERAVAVELIDDESLLEPADQHDAGDGDDELSSMEAQAAVEAELAALKSELAGAGQAEPRNGDRA